MLNECAPGWTKRKQTHHYRIDYGDKTMWNFPFGDRGKKTPKVQVHQVRKLARVLGIEECAKRVLPQLRR